MYEENFSGRIKEEQQNRLHVAICYDIGSSTDIIAPSGKKVVSNELERDGRRL
jgi:hypothetical protein